jgi:hypothetical protein
VLLPARAAVAQAPSFQPKPIGNLKEVMRGILLPNSDTIFKVADKAPADDKDGPTSNSAPWHWAKPPA